MGSIQVVHGGVAASTGHTTWHTTWHTAWHTAGHTAGHTAWHSWHSTGGSSGLWTGSLVDSHHDGVVLGLKLLLLLLVSLSILRVGLDELKTLSRNVFNGLLVLFSEVSLKLLIVEGLLNLEAVVLEGVLAFNLLSGGIILSLELVSVGYHLLDVLLGETTNVVCNGDLLGLSCGLISSADVEDTVGINVEGDLNLGGAARSRGDAPEVELAEHMVIFGHLTLTFVNLDVNTWLVVSASGEGLLLLGRDAGVSGDEDGHDTTGSLDTLGKRGDIEEEEVLDLLGTLTLEDGSLNGSTEGDGLIRVDGSVELLSVEKFGEH